MDGGPYRAQRPTPSRVVNRSGQMAQPKEPQPIAAEPKPAHRALSSRHSKAESESPLKRFLLAIIISGVILLSGVGLFAWSQMRDSAGVAIDTSGYQAVFFTNGQVYFGKLEGLNKEYLRLTDVYYLQTQISEPTGDSQNPQQTASDQNDVQLIKLGDEIHGPRDEMIISKQQVLFYENLKPEGTVAQSIEQHKSGQ